jgi:soluble lytic murein transglycosylase-like protein
MKAIVSSVLLLLLSANLLAQNPPADPAPWLTAVATVESNNDPNAVGDKGKAIGLYQIHKAYWQDAVDHDSTIGGKYEDCFDPEYAKRIVLAYMDRYAKEALRDGNWEKCSRIHNGGPNIMRKQGSARKKDQAAWDATTRYWTKVQNIMNGG